jgi:hypothetical protein
MEAGRSFFARFKSHKKVGEIYNQKHCTVVVIQFMHDHDL